MLGAATVLHSLTLEVLHPDVIWTSTWLLAYGNWRNEAECRMQ
jgi:hypothetical protein